MLEPEYFNDKADKMIEIYRQLEDFILKDIAGRLLKSGNVSGTADRLLWKLQQMGESREEIMNKLSKIMRLSRRELQALLQDAVLTSWEDDLSVFNQLGINITSPLENPAVRSVMDAEYRKSMGELENLTRTTMNQAAQDLVRLLDEMEVRVASGVQSYSSAVCEILDRYAKSGMQISYPTGAIRSLEAAVRMCVVTSMNQTSAQITNQYIVEGNIGYVLVSAHPGARIQPPGQPYLAGHENWQGKVYRIHGSEPGYPNLEEMTGYRIDEDGTGHVVNPLGLHGYNCQHSHQGWDKRLKNRYVDENGNSVIDKEASRELYKKKQKQRAMECAIRKTKRELLMKQKEIDMIAETDVKEMLQADYDKLAYKLRKQNKVYNDFSEKNELPKQFDRLKVAGFKRAQAAKANGRATAYDKMNKASEKTGKTPMEKSEPVSYNKRTQEELTEAAVRIKREIGQYADNPSKWSGKIEVDNTLLKKGILGRKEWSCDIKLIDSVDDGVIWHEMLHSCSASYYDENTYAINQAIEEASVEFLKQQICKRIKLPTIDAYQNYVAILRAVNNKFQYGTDFEFAKQLFNVPLPDRYQWIEDIVDESLRNAGASFEDYNDVMQFLGGLKGEIK